MTFPSVRRTLRYISHLGLRSGLQAARLHARAGAVVSVQLPRVSRPLWARTGTSDVATFAEVFMTRQYDLPLADFEPAHILDLGANVGYAAVSFAAQWPQARILAVEPAAANFALLQRNTREWPGITALRGAVWSHSTRVRIANPDDAANAFRMGEFSAAGDDEVPAFTVPQLMAMADCTYLDLLKMDVEGAEREIFRRSPEWLDHIGVLVVELHDRVVPGCAEALYGALQGRRFAQEISGGNLVIDFRVSRTAPPAE